MRLSRILLGVVAGLPAPIAAFVAVLGSALLAFGPGVGEAASGIAVAAEAPQSTSAATSPSGPRAAELEAEASALLERWAPSFAQNISLAHPERDRPLRIDFDGDWDATNNWAHLTPQVTQSPAAVYGSAILTRTHAYLTYALFYPRDWFSPVCVSYICHDNDLEVALLAVKRAEAPEQSEIVFLETKAHNDYLAIRGNELAFDGAGRPWIEIESQGHGMRPLQKHEAPAPSTKKFVAGHPLADSAGSAAAGDSAETFELVSLRETLWARRDPRASQNALWASGETGFLAYGGTRHGRRGFLLGASMAGQMYAGGVRPPWGLKAAAGERGDWFFDPAFVALERHGDWLGHAAPSLDYVLNPFVDDLARECVDVACPSIAQPPFRLSGGTGLVGGFLLALGLVSLSARRRAPAGWPRFGRRWRAR